MRYVLYDDVAGTQLTLLKHMFELFGIKDTGIPVRAITFRMAAGELPVLRVTYAPIAFEVNDRKSFDVDKACAEARKRLKSDITNSAYRALSNWHHKFYAFNDDMWAKEMNTLATQLNRDAGHYKYSCLDKLLKEVENQGDYRI